MTFKMKGATAATNTKVYLQPTADGAAPGSRHFEYVTADTAATCAASGYITKATAGHEEAYDMLQVGDLIWIYTVGSIDDSITVSADKAAGITDISLHVVLVKSATVINLSDDMLAFTVTGQSS